MAEKIKGIAEFENLKNGFCWILISKDEVFYDKYKKKYFIECTFVKTTLEYSYSKKNWSKDKSKTYIPLVYSPSFSLLSLFDNSGLIISTYLNFRNKLPQYRKTKMVFGNKGHYRDKQLNYELRSDRSELPLTNHLELKEQTYLYNTKYAYQKEDIKERPKNKIEFYLQIQLIIDFIIGKKILHILSTREFDDIFLKHELKNINGKEEGHILFNANKISTEDVKRIAPLFFLKDKEGFGIDLIRSFSNKLFLKLLHNDFEKRYINFDFPINGLISIELLATKFRSLSNNNTIEKRLVTTITNIEYIKPENIFETTKIVLFKINDKRSTDKRAEKDVENYTSTKHNVEANYQNPKNYSAEGSSSSTFRDTIGDILELGIENSQFEIIEADKNDQFKRYEKNDLFVLKDINGLTDEVNRKYDSKYGAKTNSGNSLSTDDIYVKIIEGAINYLNKKYEVDIKRVAINTKIKDLKELQTEIIFSNLKSNKGKSISFLIYKLTFNEDVFILIDGLKGHRICILRVKKDESPIVIKDINDEIIKDILDNYIEFQNCKWGNKVTDFLNNLDIPLEIIGIMNHSYITEKKVQEVKEEMNLNFQKKLSTKLSSKNMASRILVKLKRASIY